MTWQTKLMDVEYKTRMEERIEIARNALQMGMAVDDIAKLTGLAHDEIENLQ